jgi:hypothetical protein
MDLFTTFVNLAGLDIPSDRVIDGLNLAKDFGIQISAPDIDNKIDFHQERSVFYYRGNLLMAIRQGSYKMHLWTWTTPDNELEKVQNSINLMV